MKNVFGDSDSDPEDSPPIKVRKIAEMPLSVPKMHQKGQRAHTVSHDFDEDAQDSDDARDSDIDAQVDKLNEHVTTTPIPTNNQASVTKSIMDPESVAFRMMQKMGYKMGQTLGSSQNANAIHEPITSQKIKGRSGIGAKSARPVVIPDSDVTVSSQKISQYRDSESQKHRGIMNKKTLLKLKDFCLRASGDEAMIMAGDPVLDDVNALWRDRAIELHRLTYPDSNTSNDVSSIDTGAEFDLLLDYCRSRFSYCPYCEVQYDDADDMEAHCPGRYFDAH